MTKSRFTSGIRTRNDHTIINDLCPRDGVDAALPNGVIMHQHYGALAIGIGEAT